MKVASWRNFVNVECAEVGWVSVERGEFDEQRDAWLYTGIGGKFIYSTVVVVLVGARVGGDSGILDVD